MFYISTLDQMWFNFLNAGHYSIPYYFGKSRTCTFHFNETSILTDFTYNQED